MSKREHTAWKPALYDDFDIAALRSLARGEASDVQQRRALEWIVNKACGTYDQPFTPGEGGARETDFACGKMFVGQQIVKLTKLVPQRKTENT